MPVNLLHSLNSKACRCGHISCSYAWGDNATVLPRPSPKSSCPQGGDMPADNEILPGLDCRICRRHLQRSGCTPRQAYMPCCISLGRMVMLHSHALPQLSGVAACPGICRQVRPGRLWPWSTFVLHARQDHSLGDACSQAGCNCERAMQGVFRQSLSSMPQCFWWPN